jgi:hypothetical protein
MSIELARTEVEEIAHLEAQTRRFAAENGSSWVESEGWETPAGVVVCRVQKKRMRGGLLGMKRTWLLNWRPLGHNALMGKIRDAA